MGAKQLVHYVGHGRGGLAFDCYFTELNAHLGSKRAGTGEIVQNEGDTLNPTRWVGAVYDLPMPLRHTSLDRVSCPDCWDEILKMAKRRL